MAEIYGDISSPALSELQGYLNLLADGAGKASKLQYVETHHAANWAAINGKAPYTKGKIITYMRQLQAAYVFPEDSFEAKMVQADKLMAEEKAVKKEVKEMAEILHLKTKETIEGLSDAQVLDLLRLKWITPLCASLRAMPDAVISALENEVQILKDKYALTYLELEEQIARSEKSLSGMLEELTGNEYDMKGLRQFKSLLLGE